MKICDKCWNTKGDIVKSTEMLRLSRLCSEYELCESCKEEFIRFLTDPVTEDTDGRSKGTARKAKKDK